MRVRKTPPGRRSISQSTVVHGAGVNHFLTCSGLVHAAQTSSGRTSTKRSRRRSKRGSGMPFMRVTVVSPSDRSGKCPAGRGGVPTARVGRPSSVPPPSTAAAPAEDAHAARLLRADQAAVFQNGKMLSERWQCHVEWPRQLAHRSRTAAQPAQNRAPRRISQGAKDTIKLYGFVRHVPNYRPPANLGQCLTNGIAVSDSPSVGASIRVEFESTLEAQVAPSGSARPLCLEIAQGARWRAKRVGSGTARPSSRPLRIKIKAWCPSYARRSRARRCRVAVAGWEDAPY